MTQRVNHFLDIHRIERVQLQLILGSAASMKANYKRGEQPQLLAGKQLAMIFEKPSTRTRVSFEVGINQLGGHAIVLDSQSTQMGRGEPILDTANVLSRYVDLIMLRCYEHRSLEMLAYHASVPVINGLSNKSHPCQVMADLLTIKEYYSATSQELKDLTIAWVGDGNNVANSWIHAAMQFKCKLNLATPEAYAPDAETLRMAEESRAKVTVYRDPKEAVKGAHVVITDCWVSMGDEDEDARRAAFAPYQVTMELMALADPHVVFLHCLPAHRGEEVTEEVIDGNYSLIYNEAENRLHIQKAIMCWTHGMV